MEGKIFAIKIPQEIPKSFRENSPQMFQKNGLTDSSKNFQSNFRNKSLNNSWMNPHRSYCLNSHRNSRRNTWRNSWGIPEAIFGQKIEGTSWEFPKETSWEFPEKFLASFGEIPKEMNDLLQEINKKKTNLRN